MSSFPLVIYKASAGSGKTFTLAVEYISLLISNPDSYRNILAVTFTNKATNEMKMRILSHLYGISHNLPDSKDYLEQVKKRTELDEPVIISNAGKALGLLLHNYNYFRVETIDSFFQAVLRNLARELDLTPNLRIELRDEEIESKSVDKMIEELKPGDNVLSWILEYISDNMSNDKGWNVIRQIKDFGRTIFKDFYKENQEQISAFLSSSDSFNQYRKMLRDIKKDAEEKLQSIPKEFYKIIDKEGFEIKDFSYGSSGVAGFFVKIEEGRYDSGIVTTRVSKAVNSADAWVSKSSSNHDDITALARSVLIPLLQQSLTDRETLWRQYHNADVTLKHLNQLRLLNDIEKRVRRYNESSNTFLLSDTQYLLHRLISESDAPFIYEKIGAQLKHVMIDEFQDTSSLQWQNFKVLLKESMSHADAFNMIVGDVKQSIYRWRSGDWRLLSNLKDEFKGAAKDIPLDTNYRSQKNIVTFNNQFFIDAVAYETGENVDAGSHLGKAYEEVIQKLPNSKKDNNMGLVDIQLVPRNTDYESRTLNYISDKIRMLLSQGVKQKDIAILVRTNKSIPVIANYFVENHPDIVIVSDEAFRLDGSPAVKILSEALRLIAHPNDMLTRCNLAVLYQLHVMGNPLGSGTMLLADGSPNSLLPQKFIDEMRVLSTLPLYELAENIYQIFNLQILDKQSGYVCAFYDLLTSFVNDNTSDIDAFLEQWDTTLCSNTIQGDEADGVRIVSIHKSKGLEYDNVIVPFCDWRLEMAGDILWCKPGESPYDKLPLVPVDFSARNMLETIYEKDYKEETLQLMVDNMNLLYVAFTRASNNLFVMGTTGEKGRRSSLIQNCIETVCKNLNAIIDGSATLEECEDDNGISIHFSFGSLFVGKEKEKKVTHNKLLQQSENKIITVSSFDSKVEFRQSNRSRQFIDNANIANITIDADNINDLEATSNKTSSQYINIGLLMHRVLSTITTLDDLPHAIDQLHREGLVGGTSVSYSRLESLLRQRLSANGMVQRWFASGWQVFNECKALVSVDGMVKELRPDRAITNGTDTIVIDFKFAAPLDEHRRQVSGYMRLLESMGYPGVKGYLWYVYTNKIIEVK